MIGPKLTSGWFWLRAQALARLSETAPRRSSRQIYAARADLAFDYWRRSYRLRVAKVRGE